MKKHKLLIFLIALLSNSVLFAQKAADIQQGSLWLSNVKIDGKLNEWPSPLKAFNKATHCWYSVANDEQNVYFAINTDRSGKIQAGGVTFLINGAEITFPYNRRRDRRLKENNGPIKPGQPIFITDYKEFHIKNVASIKDTLISIYNTQGLKVSIGEYRNQEDIRCYNYEIAIPLKLLGKINDQGKISYKIRLNGIVTFGPSGGRPTPIPGKSAKYMMELEESGNDLERVSQLSGQYVLAKKP